LAVVFKKQEISQQVVTTMQDLTSEFSKNFPGVIPPNPHSRRGRPPLAPNTQSGLWPGAERKLLGVRTQTLVPWTFQPYGCAPE